MIRPCWKIIVVLVLLFTSACTPSPKKQAERQARKKATTLAVPLEYEGFLRDIQEFRTRTLSYLAANDSLMDQFRCRLEAENKEDNPYYRRAIAELEKKNREMKRKVDGYRASHPREWKKFKEDFGIELAELNQSYRALKVRNTHPEIDCQ